jgi:hypothetical protein
MQRRADWWVRPGDVVAKWGQSEKFWRSELASQIADPRFFHLGLLNSSTPSRDRQPKHKSSQDR